MCIKIEKILRETSNAQRNERDTRNGKVEHPVTLILLDIARMLLCLFNDMTCEL